MGKIYFSIVLLVSFAILVGKVSCSTSLRDVSEEYSRELVSLKNVVKSVRHIIRMRPATNMPHYCALIFSPPGDRPLTMINMLRLTLKTLVIINTWADSEGNYTVANCHTCRGCENLIIFATMPDVTKVISKVDANCTGARIELLVATYDVLDSAEEAEKSAKTVVDFAWKQIRGFATVLVPVGDRVLALKCERHVPFIRCEPESPRIMSYLENGTFVGNLSFDRFDPNKCVLRVSTASHGHHARLEKVNGTETVAGIEGQILKTITELQNYTMEAFNAIPFRNKSISEAVLSNATLIREKLLSGEADIAAYGMWVYNRENMRYTYSYASQWVVLMIPTPKYIPFTSILHTFSRTVWICIGVSWIVGRLMVRMNRRSISSLMALALFLGVGVASQSRGFVEKWQMMLWVTYGYLITQSYIASLASALNNPLVHKIETIEELAATDIQVVGSASQRENFGIDDKYKRIMDTYIIVQQPERTTMMKNPDTFFPKPEQTGLLLDISSLKKHSWLSRYYQLKERIKNLPLGMAVMSRSRVSLSEIDRGIASLVENGLVHKWQEDNTRPSRSQRISSELQPLSPTLSLEEVAGILVILVVGCFLSIIVFVYEICKKKTSKNNSWSKIRRIEFN